MNFLEFKSVLAHRITLWKAITPAIIKLPAEREQGQTSVTEQTTELCWKITEHSQVYTGNKVSESAQRPCETKTCQFHISKMIIGREISVRHWQYLWGLESKHWAMLSFLMGVFSDTFPSREDEKNFKQCRKCKKTQGSKTKKKH